jgi:gp16 family phage-associated protein
MTPIAPLDAQANANVELVDAGHIEQAFRSRSLGAQGTGFAVCSGPARPCGSTPPLPPAGRADSGTHTALTAQDAWRQLRSAGLTAREWAEQHGFEPSLVYSVLTGSRKCLRGQSFLVARALGMK